MEHTASDTLLQAQKYSTEQFYPRVSGQPWLVIWTFSFAPNQRQKVLMQLRELLPEYWKSEGIFDCKILATVGRNSVLVIESWENPDFRVPFLQSSSWQSFTGATPHKTIKEITCNTFELIE